MAKGNVWRVAFQCPDNGYYTLGTYAFGKVMFEASTDQDLLEGYPDLHEETTRWCKSNGNKRCRSVDDANEYLRSLGIHEFFENERWM